MECFPDIENMTIERFYQQYLKSNGLQIYRIVVLGVWSVNVKNCIKFLTDDPGKFMMYRKIYRGFTHHRKRPQNRRFTAVLENQQPSKKSIIGYDPCWLGNTWWTDFNDKRYPSLNQIEKGLTDEAIYQTELAMGGINKQKLIIEAKNNIAQTWHELLSLANIYDRDEELTFDMKKGTGLVNPYHPVTTLCIFIYQMENYAYHELNRACRQQDRSKVATLGPWALTLGTIVYKSQSNRVDLEVYDHRKKQ